MLQHWACDPARYTRIYTRIYVLLSRKYRRIIILRCIVKNRFNLVSLSLSLMFSLRYVFIMVYFYDRFNALVALFKKIKNRTILAIIPLKTGLLSFVNT